MNEELAPLPPEVTALLAVERQELDPSAALQDRIRAGLQSRLAQPQVQTGHGAGKTVRDVLGHKLSIAVLSLGIGAAGGALAHAKLSQPAVATAIAVEPAAPPIPIPAAVPVVAPASPEPEAKPHPPAHHAMAPTAHAGPSGGDPSLAAERALVERARTALGRRDSAAALQALDAHLQQFPSGQLSEERDVLRIQSLVAAGRPSEARLTADGFKAKYPKSMLLPVVQSALQANP